MADDLTQISMDELTRRLNNLAVEYDQAAKAAMAKLAKVDNLRKELSPLAEELSRRMNNG